MQIHPQDIILGATALVALLVFAPDPVEASTVSILGLQQSIVASSDCGWTKVKRRDGSTSLRLDTKTWISSRCAETRRPLLITPTPNKGDSTPIRVGCDYRIYKNFGGSRSSSGISDTNALNRMCLDQNRVAKANFAKKKKLLEKKAHKIAIAQEKALKAQKMATDSHLAMKAAYDEAKAYHDQKNWPAHRRANANYETKLAQYQKVDSEYKDLVQTYQALLVDV